jgi:hypothetical protein
MLTKPTWQQLLPLIRSPPKQKNAVDTAVASTAESEFIKTRFSANFSNLAAVTASICYGLRWMPWNLVRGIDDVASSVAIAAAVAEKAAAHGNSMIKEMFE